MKDTRPEYHRELMRKKRIKGRLCETCGVRPALAHHRASAQTRTIVMCGLCMDRLGIPRESESS